MRRRYRWAWPPGRLEEIVPEQPVSFPQVPSLDMEWIEAGVWAGSSVMLGRVKFPARNVRAGGSVRVREVWRDGVLTHLEVLD